MLVRKYGGIKMTKQEFRLWLKGQLRRISYRWKPRTEVKRKARVRRGVYKCKKCKGEFGNRQVVVDHLNPVVPVTGWTNWDDIIARMFCKVSGLQVLCRPCHKKKTDKENKKRKCGGA